MCDNNSVMATTTTAGKSRRSPSTVDYSQISDFFISDFVPSRETRISSNPFLQEHSCFSSPPLPHPRSALSSSSGSNTSASHQVIPLKNNYIELDFSPPVSATRRTVSDSTEEEGLYDYTFTGSFLPRSSSDPTRTVTGFNKSKSKSDNNHTKSNPIYVNTVILDEEDNASSNLDRPFRSRLCALEGNKMERPVSFAMAITEDPIHFDESSPSRGTSESHYYLNVKRKEGRNIPTTNLSRSSSPSPPPSKGLIISTRPPSPLLISGRDTPPITTETHPSRRLCSTQQRTNSLENLYVGNGKNKRPSLSTSNLDRFITADSSTRQRRSSDPSSFHKSLDSCVSSGEEIARFNACCYIGNCSVDQYLGCVNESAKKVIDPKMNTKSTDVLVQVCAEKIRLFPPRPGPLFKSFSIAEIMSVSQCFKNKRLVGIVIWKRKSLPQCHLLRCSDQLISNGLLESIQYAVQCVNEADKFHHSLPISNSCSNISSYKEQSDQNSDSLQVIYIGSTCANRHHTISDIVGKTLSDCKPSQSQEINLNLKLTHIELIDIATKSILLLQSTSSVQTLGVYQEEGGHYLGYISGDPIKGPLAGHVLWCGRYQETINVATAFRRVCQVSFQQMLGKGSEAPIQPNIFSRLKSFKNTSNPSSPISSSSPSFQSYVFNPSPQLLDIPRKCKDVVSVPAVIPTVTDCSEEDFAKFSVTYVGTANLSTPFTYSSITQALDAFKEKGVAGGMAPPTSTKYSIEMYISSLGINLSDKKQKMFVNRNYPRKQISGCSQHLMDRRYFSFATLRPGFSDQLKVHVFMEINFDTSNQVMKSIKFWLQINPLTE